MNIIFVKKHHFSPCSRGDHRIETQTGACGEGSVMLPEGSR